MYGRYMEFNLVPKSFFIILSFRRVRMLHDRTLFLEMAAEENAYKIYFEKPVSLDSFPL